MRCWLLSFSWSDWSSWTAYFVKVTSRDYRNYNIFKLLKNDHFSINTNQEIDKIKAKTVLPEKEKK